eukprot:CAMPEP_0201726280 /NCGR_PEP_ID=MMETSP0593-20130828/9361_1 /ASSEMBLY_ACC=CAM_ASM_000672 /TAXON_ID=267983 /ORGANISM="Skeletonema japonicum, Strain CCMP2506" /LENGTH=675 /DNA_ID=CAMNT_0048217753 /DNA_START=35 /DNA_END=2059 /DNA_ORIENTATION=-
MALILVLLFFVVFKVDDEETSQDLLLHCRSTCNDLHIQSAAMNNPYPPSSSTASGSISSTIDTLFLRRKLDEEQSASFRPSVTSSTHLASKSSPQVRPRRLPTLIKVLTGYDDEPYWNVPKSTDRLGRTHTPAIAYVNKPKIEPSQQKRKRRVRSSDDTVQIAAAAAATAVWSQSTSTFGSCRMNRVNSEWDAALRWIAGWDSTNVSEDMSLNDWANHLVDNLTAVLEECIEKCSRGEDFGSTNYIEQDGVHSFSAVKSVSSSIGDVLWRSIFGWVFGRSLRLSTSFGSLDAVVQVIASTAAVYVIHSLWSSGWPLITDWFRTLRYFEAPDEWLIQHEKELELAKSSRARQKKGKKSKKKQKQRKSAKKSILDNDAAKNKSLDSTSGYEVSVRNFDDVTSSAVDDDVVPATDSEYADIHEDQSGFVKPNPKTKFAASKDSVGPSSMNDGVPSVISLSSAASVTSSPSIKPRSPSPSNIPENETLESNAAFSSPIVRSGVYSQQLNPGKNAFAVPTVEQRNEAANQLRDFQNAQIRRLVLQKQQKLAQDGRFNLPGNDSTAAVAFGGNVSGQMKVLKPPPGFSAFNPVPQDRYPANLDENELLLSRLLDDDDDDDDEVEDINVSLPISAGSSLDPSAKPFFASNECEQLHRLEPRSTKANGQWSGKIKGVYGGNVW